MSEQTETRTDNLVDVTINGAMVRAEKGRILIDVAEEAGVFVPRFCYHPGMKSVAVCRMCLVQVEGQRKLVPACATPVDQGMNVNTVDPDAVDAQKDVLEFLLINHPLDCPICDRAGECPLQDQTYAHGPGASRYTEEKRTYEKALEISELVVLDRERCVLCWRCVRFSDEIAGDRFIQLVDRGDGTQILNFKDEPFDSYFSGNTIQICPVGALTSKPYRFLARPWDLETAPSVCTYCSVGCPITNESRQESMVRCQALPNEEVNDFWICDKGRFGYHHVSSEDRLETPLLRGSNDEFDAIGWGQALSTITEKLKDKKNVGIIAGPHLTTEDAWAISKLSKTIGTPDIDSRLQDIGAPYELLLDYSNVAGSTATFTDVKDAKTIVWIGPDPKEALPILFLHLHAAVREKGAKLIVVSPRSISLDGFASKVVRGGVAEISDLASELEGDAVVCWGPAAFGRDETAILRAAASLAAAGGAKLLVCPPSAGSQGMIDMGVLPGLDAGYKPVDSPGRDTRQILEAAANKELDALLIFGADPIADFPDAGLARRALESGTFTVTVELFPTETALLSDVILPSTAYAEREGTFTNLERRLQKLEALLAPPGAAREPWKTALGIARAVGDDWGWRTFEDVWSDLKKNVPTHAGIDLERLKQEAPLPHPHDSTGFAPEDGSSSLTVAGPGGQYPKGHRGGAPFQTGQNWPLSWEIRAFEARQRPGQIPTPGGELAGGVAPEPADVLSSEGTFALLAGRFLYDEGTMIARTAALRNIQQRPFVELNADDAKSLGISEGDEVILEGAGTEVTLPAKLDGIARGHVFVPYDQWDFRANVLMKGPDPRVSVRRS